jgi:hypothetical protein
MMPNVAQPRDRLTNLLSRCYNDPSLFNTAILGRNPYWWRQEEICRSICDYRITVVYSGNAIGKDYVLGGVIPWWLYTRHRSLVIATGPSQTLLGSVTWKEVRLAIEHSKIPLGAKLSNGIRASPQTVTLGTDWQALGYSTTSVERASGQHNRKLLVIGEEASAIDDEIYDALDSLKFVKLFLIGNPTRPDGRFVSLIQQAAADQRNGVPRHQAVNAIHIPSTDSPHADWPESPFGLADQGFLEDMRRRHGETSLWWKVHILAIIPTTAAETLIPESWLDFAASRHRSPLPLNHPLHTTRRIACDLGEGVGRDSTCVLVRDKDGILEVICSAAIGLAEAASAIADMARKWNVPHHLITYDRLGIGKNMPHHLVKHGITEAEGYAGEGHRCSHDFTNFRSECAWRLRQRLDPQFAPDSHSPHQIQPPFVIPAEAWWPRLREELRVLEYGLAGRKTKLMLKEHWCARLGHSPDIADALIQSFALEE